MRCLDQSSSWLSASADHTRTANYTTRWTNSIYFSTSTSFHITWTCTSTCSDIFYADSATTLGSSVIVSSRVIGSGETILISPFTTPKPTCIIPSDVCASMTSAYSASALAWKSESSLGKMVSPTWPYCNGWPSWCIMSAEGRARLFYWPVPKTVSRNMCFSGGTVKTDMLIKYKHSDSSYSTGYVPAAF